MIFEIAITAAAVLLFYWCWLWFVAGVRQNYLERRMYVEPPTGGPWVQPRRRYEDLPQ